MNDPVIVRILERIANLRDHRQSLAGRDATFGGQLTEVHPIDEFHQEVIEAIRAAEFVERDDVRMVELGEGARLAGEAFGKGSVLPDVGREDFQATIRSSSRWRAL